MAASTPSVFGSVVASQSVLVVGASFAGLSTAIWLRRLGYRVTVVEIAQGLRRGGTPVDIEGESVDILTRMGLMDAVRTRALPPRRVELQRADGTVLVSVSPEDDGDAQDGPARLEIHRDDLLDILADELAGGAELLFGCSVNTLVQGAEAVSVTFTGGEQRDFALVFGCDGNRSKTRRLAFDDRGQFSHFLGGYFYLKVVPKSTLVAANKSEFFNAPGRVAMLNGYDDRTDIGFGLRTDHEIDGDYRDKDWRRRLIHEHFDGLAWKVPDMLAWVDHDDAAYFDRITQIRMPAWSRGRVVLVGDAGYCVSPLAGLGGSMAIIGAGRLGEALARHPGDHEAAFRDYEEDLRAFVEEVQERAATEGVERMFPADEAGLAERDHKFELGGFRQ